MKKPSELYVIQEPEAPAARDTVQRKLICAQEPAWPRAVERPWPRQVAWRDFPGPTTK